MELLELLMNGKVEEFNQKRNRRGTVDLFGADLSEARLPGVDLSSANLEKADLSGADLSDAVLARADLSGADLTNAQLTGSMGVKSRWREAYMGGVNLREVDFTGADLTEAEAVGGDFSSGVFTGVRAKKAIFSRSRMSGADWSEARLDDAQLDGCDLSGANFKEANLTGAVLKGAVLVEADLGRAQLERANLAGADLRNARLESANLSGADLTGANLLGANLTRADLKDARLEPAQLKGAIFADAQVGRGIDVDGGEDDEPVELLIEDPSIAARGDAIAVVWDNPEGEGKTRMRIAAGPLHQRWEGHASSVPEPSDLIIARALTATPSGFALVLLVERPGGVTASLVPFDTRGRIGEVSRHRLPYTPAARPILRWEGNGLVLYGISREGPGICIHRVSASGLDVLYARPMPNLKGFVSDHQPVVLTKGGMVFRLGPSGPGEAMRVPAGFPGKRCAACVDGDGLFLTWVSAQAPGLFRCRTASGQAPEEEHLIKRHVVGTIDAASGPAGAWAGFAREPAKAGAPGSAWLLRVPEGEPASLVDSPRRDVTEVRMVPTDQGPLVAVAFDDGSLEAYSPESPAQPVWTLVP